MKNYSRCAYEWSRGEPIATRAELLYGYAGRAATGHLSHSQLGIARALVKRAIDDSAACTSETEGRYEIHAHERLAETLAPLIEAGAPVETTEPGAAHPYTVVAVVAHRSEVRSCEQATAAARRLHDRTTSAGWSGRVSAYHRNGAELDWENR